MKRKFCDHLTGTDKNSQHKSRTPPVVIFLQENTSSLDDTEVTLIQNAPEVLPGVLLSQEPASSLDESEVISVQDDEDFQPTELQVCCNGRGYHITAKMLSMSSLLETMKRECKEGKENKVVVLPDTYNPLLDDIYVLHEIFCFMRGKYSIEYDIRQLCTIYRVGEQLGLAPSVKETILSVLEDIFKKGYPSTEDFVTELFDGMRILQSMVPKSIRREFIRHLGNMNRTFLGKFNKRIVEELTKEELFKLLSQRS